MNRILHDLRHGVRLMRRSPVVAGVVILTLALGIGANTAIFSIVNGVLLNPLPYTDPAQLVRVSADLLGLNLRDVGVSVPEFDDLRDRAGVFDRISAVSAQNEDLTGADRPERLELLVVSVDYFRLLGARPQLGRVFGPQDDVPGFSEGAVISDGLWRRRFGADPAIIGRKVRLDNDPATIIGVMPPGFRHPGPTLETDVDVWSAAGFRGAPFPIPARRTRTGSGAIARLRPGLCIRQAQQVREAVAAVLRREDPQD